MHLPPQECGGHDEEETVVAEPDIDFFILSSTTRRLMPVA